MSSNVLEMVMSAKTGGDIHRGTIRSITETGELVVELDGAGKGRQLCDLLDTGGAQVKLSPGDKVLVVVPLGAGGAGCVLGRVGRHKSHDLPDSGREQAAPPDHLVLEAGQEIALICGKSKILLRQDGKIVVRGLDVVSRASRVQRIKGGSVQIN